MEPPSSPMKKGAILLAQPAGNHARRAETALTRFTPLLRRQWGRLVTKTFTGQLGARSRFTSALSLAAPISSERLGQKPICGIQEALSLYFFPRFGGFALDTARPLLLRKQWKAVMHRTHVVQKIWQIFTKTKTNKTKPQPETTPTSPSQICVSRQSKTAKQPRTGQGPTRTETKPNKKMPA